MKYKLPYIIYFLFMIITSGYSDNRIPMIDNSIAENLSVEDLKKIENFRVDTNIDLSLQAIQEIRESHIQKHFNYLGHFQRDDRWSRLQQWWYCRRIHRTFVDFNNFFPTDVEETEVPVPDSVREKMDDKAFYIWPHSSVYYEVYDIKLAPDLDSARKIQLTQYGEWFPYTREDELVLYYKGNNINFKNDTVNYILYGIYDEVIEARAVVAFNARTKDVIFLSGNVLPLKNMSSKIVSELDHSWYRINKPFIISRSVNMPIEPPLHHIRKSPTQIDQVRISGQAKNRLPDDYDFKSYYGLHEYARMLIEPFFSFYATPFRTQFYDYDNGNFIFRVYQNFSSVAYYPECKSNVFDRKEGMAFWPNRICNNYYDSVITELLVSINPETGEVGFKIKETEDFSHLPECSKKE